MPSQFWNSFQKATLEILRNGILAILALVIEWLINVGGQMFFDQVQIDPSIKPIIVSTAFALLRWLDKFIHTMQKENGTPKIAGIEYHGITGV